MKTKTTETTATAVEEFIPIPPLPPNPPPGEEFDAILKECHQLLDKLRYRSGAMKLLLLTRQTLLTYVAYKANRDNRRM